MWNSLGIVYPVVSYVKVLGPSFMFRVNRGDFVYINCRSVVLCAQLDASV